MNSAGQYTDRFGRVLDVAATVEIIDPTEDVHGVAEIIALPPLNSDYYGYPRVRLHLNGKAVYVPDNNLRLLYPHTLVGHLEKAIDAAKAYNAQLRDLIAQAKASGMGRAEIFPGTFARRGVRLVEVGDQVLVERDPDKGLLAVTWSGPSTLFLRSADSGQPVEVSDPYLVTVTAVRPPTDEPDGAVDPDEVVYLETAEGTVFVPDGTAVAVPIVEYSSGQRTAVDEVTAALRAAAAKFAHWTDDELGDEMALRRDNGENTDEIGLAIIARGGNPMPSPVEQSLHYEARNVLRGNESGGEGTN